MKKNNHSNKLGAEFFQTMADGAQNMMNAQLQKVESLLGGLPPQKQALFRDAIKEAKAGKLDMKRLETVLRKLTK